MFQEFSLIFPCLLPLPYGKLQLDLIILGVLAPNLPPPAPAAPAAAPPLVPAAPLLAGAKMVNDSFYLKE